ncbi:type II secretion system minor pseudopilin GspJ [Andreprevotia chitinilytica]|uniref:type II secretion system minor pseudopilin GspJ n=1 Tax=Andreprevotia chitinilytica TaxID=396808 RepID=UPI00068D515A|nr:type II secretion system minor pseudopilin GspJ [Andreprevotia chitinilytica]
MSGRFRSRARGFTLIEVLVALMVFAVVALIAYQGLSRIVEIKTRLDEEAHRWRELSLVLDRIEEDVSQAVNRPWRNTGGITQPAVRGGGQLAQAGYPALELVRVVRDRDPYHVAYRLHEGRLEMLLWDSLDLAPRAQPRTFLLLPKVERFEVYFLDGNNAWQSDWPPTVGNMVNSVMPRAIKVVLARAGEAQVERVYALP